MSKVIFREIHTFVLYKFNVLFLLYGIHIPEKPTREFPHSEDGTRGKLNFLKAQGFST
jgi:hypothetical protein